MKKDELKQIKNNDVVEYIKWRKENYDKGVIISFQWLICLLLVIIVCLVTLKVAGLIPNSVQVIKDCTIRTITTGGIA